MVRHYWTLLGIRVLTGITVVHVAIRFPETVRPTVVPVPISSQAIHLYSEVGNFGRQAGVPAIDNALCDRGTVRTRRFTLGLATYGARNYTRKYYRFQLPSGPAC